MPFLSGERRRWTLGRVRFCHCVSACWELSPDSPRHRVCEIEYVRGLQRTFFIFLGDGHRRYLLLFKCRRYGRWWPRLSTTVVLSTANVIMTFVFWYHTRCDVMITRNTTSFHLGWRKRGGVSSLLYLAMQLYVSFHWERTISTAHRYFCKSPDRPK